MGHTVVKGKKTTDKANYRLTQNSRDSKSNPPIKFGEDTYIGFAFMLNPTMEKPVQSTHLLQIWQGGHTSPPLSLRLFGSNEEDNDKITLHVEYRNDKTGGDPTNGETFSKKKTIV